MKLAPITAPTVEQSLLSNGRFVVLWIALFSSTFGSVLLLMSLSLKTFADTGSGLLAGSVYGSQWLLPIALLPFIGWLNTRYPIFKLLVLTQLVSAIVTLVVGAIYPQAMPLFFVLMTLRGFLENLGKSGAAVALKLNMSPEILERASSYYDTSRYLASASASLTGMLLLSSVSIEVIAGISAASFAIAALCYLLLPAVSAACPNADWPGFRYWPETWDILRRNPTLGRNFLYLSVVTGIFQGYYYIARSALPIGHLGMSASAAALVQALISVSFIAGAAFVARWMRGGSRLADLLPPLAQTSLASLFMAGSVATQEPLIGVGAFLVFLFWYEVIYTSTNNIIMLSCAADEIGYVSCAKNGGLNLAMILVIIVGGLLVDAVGFEATTLLLAAIVFLAIFGLRARRTILIQPQRADSTKEIHQ